MLIGSVSKVTGAKGTEEQGLQRKMLNEFVLFEES